VHSLYAPTVCALVFLRVCGEKETNGTSDNQSATATAEVQIHRFFFSSFLLAYLNVTPGDVSKIQLSQW
jgi:hypothetical protein